MKKVVGLFEAKAKLSELCEQVARTRQAVTITRRGKPLVQLLPVEDRPPSILERRRAYLERHAAEENEDREDFEPPPRSRARSSFDLEE